MSGRDEEFDKWFEKYFCNTQTEDSPFSFMDVKIAFFTGWKKHKEHSSNNVN